MQHVCFGTFADPQIVGYRLAKLAPWKDLTWSILLGYSARHGHLCCGTCSAVQQCSHVEVWGHRLNCP
jgi:hypothetical protein